MMTFRKIVFLHFLQLAFVAASVILVATEADTKLLIVCLLCSGIFHVRFLVWWYAWIRKIRRVTARLAGWDMRRAKAQSSGPFQQIEVNLVAVESKIMKHRITRVSGAPGVVCLDTRDKEAPARAGTTRVLDSVEIN